MKVKNKVVKIVIFLLCATCFATEMNLKNKIELKNISNCQIQEENQNEFWFNYFYRFSFRGIFKSLYK